MTDRELTRLALIDAFNFQHGEARAHGADTVAGTMAIERARHYREMLERKFKCKDVPVLKSAMAALAKRSAGGR